MKTNKIAGSKVRKGPQGFRKIYWKNCSVCQFMKKNPTFRLRVMQSTYFKPEGKESLAMVIHDFGDPFPLSTCYAHMSRHQDSDIIKARKRFQEVAPPGDTQSLTSTADALEGEVVSKSQHEIGLDEFIKEGREQLLRKEMPITATTYLQAIKIRTDIDKNTKDRRLEAAKAFFTKDGQTKT